MNVYLKTICAALTVAALYGCGDDSHNGNAALTDSSVLPAGRAVLTFSAISTARLPAAISGINLAVDLPAGISVSTVSGASGPIDNASATAGSALVGTNLAYGTYSASTGRTRLSMATTSDKYRSGEFLRLSCNVAANSGVTLGSLKSRVSLLKAIGYDPVSQSTVTLTDKVTVTLGAQN
jgi:hypothetical protein